MRGAEKFRRAVRRATTLATTAAVIIGGDLLLRHPSTPLPPEWNPTAGPSINHPVTPLTLWKLRRAMASESGCLAALAETGAAIRHLPDLENGEACHIRRRVVLSGIGGVRLDPVETRCEVALRLAYWERHGLQSAALAAFGEGIAAIEHLSSYSCRAMRTGNGETARMSLHATAEAIDITGFRLESGRFVSLIGGWDGPADEGAFLRAARDSACIWFATTLGPEYNELHTDHFHLQSRGWGLCR